MFNFIKIGKNNNNVYLKGGIRMVLVLIFLIIFIIITLFLFLVTASNLRFSLENLEVSNTKKKFNIKISLVLFKKFTWLFVNLDKTKLEKIAKKVHLDKNIFKKLDKDFKFEDLNNLKKLKPKIIKLDLEIKFGLEDVVITSYLIVAISVLISNILPFLIDYKDYSNCRYKIEPIYLNKNLYKITLNCIIEEKMVHIINILFKFLKKGRSDKYERTSNRRSYDYSNEQFAKYG